MQYPVKSKYEFINLYVVCSIPYKKSLPQWFLAMHCYTRLPLIGGFPHSCVSICASVALSNLIYQFSALIYSKPSPANAKIDKA